MRGMVFKTVANNVAPEIWKNISTTNGVKGFFSPNVLIDWVIGGKFEIFFNMDAPDGEKGSEDMIILTIEENRMLSFTWNSPPTIPIIRGQRTLVNITLHPIGDDSTLIEFTNTGYGYSEDWSKSFEYFIRAWGEIVLPRLLFVIEGGIIDWDEDKDFSEFVNRWKLTRI